MGLGTSYDWLQQEMKIVVSWQLKSTINIFKNRIMKELFCS